MWFPPLSNKGKVKITYDILSGEIPEIKPTVIFCERYKILDIPIANDDYGESVYLGTMKINGKDVTPVSKLYLDESINEVYLDYFILDGIPGLAMVLIGHRNEIYDDYENCYPPIGYFLGDSSFPRGSFYKGYIFKNSLTETDYPIFAFPLNLYEDDFEIYRNGIKFTLHLNMHNTNEFSTPTGVDCYRHFEIIKAEFYGELLPAEQIDDYIELKPKGV